MRTLKFFGHKRQIDMVLVIFKKKKKETHLVLGCFRGKFLKSFFLHFLSIRNPRANYDEENCLKWFEKNVTVLMLFTIDLQSSKVHWNTVGWFGVQIRSYNKFLFFSNPKAERCEELFNVQLFKEDHGDNLIIENFVWKRQN